MNLDASNVDDLDRRDVAMWAGGAVTTLLGIVISAGGI